MSKNVLKEYQKWVRKMWSGKAKKLTLRDHYIMSTGLGGETGEVLEILKKSVRNDVLDKAYLTEELGDVLYYLTMLCNFHDLSLEDVMNANVSKINVRYAKHLK